MRLLLDVGGAALGELGRHVPILIALATIFAVGWAGSDAFLTSNNLVNLIQRVSAISILAVGTTVLMVAGGIDLSIGAALSFISIFAAKAANAGASDAVVVVASMGMGAAIGLALGIIITATRASAFMVTLGALSVIGGAAYWMTNGSPTLIESGFRTLGITKVAGVPVSTIILAAVVVALYVALYHLRVGRLIFAIGGNEEAARLAGIRVDLIRICVYGLNSALVGLAAAILVSRVGSGGPDLGVGLELQVIAAAVIGGASLGGGYGSLFGAVLGVFLLGSITSVLNLIGANPFIANIVFGAFIILAVVLRAERAATAARWARGILGTRFPWLSERLNRKQRVAFSASGDERFARREEKIE